ncbi:hypothetical protein GGR92_002099 [Spirosoma lacussanchae]|uniref:nucleotidyltransferase family protein n=1 Tax=Spirosoma lacussanchae TaxID=1884249 RepID=UPI001107EFC6|nr:nucleotidyltransferase domain-containing protein [Spirosoma lacussanchae]
MNIIGINREFILETLKANRDHLRVEFGIERIGLYGSFARNEQTEKSDVDLVYDLAEGHRLSLVDRDRLQRVLQKKIYRKPDLINQRFMNPFTRHTMLKDVLYI